MSFVTIKNETGHPSHTQVVLPNGEVLPGVVQVHLDIHKGQVPIKATVELYVRVDVKAALQGVEVEWPGDETKKANLQEVE